MGEWGFTKAYDVTGSLIFSKNVEIFVDYEYCPTNKEGHSQNIREVILSKGQVEKQKPLPIVNAIATSFFDMLYYYGLKAFLSETNPDLNIVPKILEQATLDLGLHESHLKDTNWISPEPVSLDEYFKTFNDIFETFNQYNVRGRLPKSFKTGTSNKDIKIPLLYEIIYLMSYTFALVDAKKKQYVGEGLAGASLLINEDFLQLYKSIQVPYFYIQRIKGLTFQPLKIQHLGSSSNDTEYANKTITPAFSVKSSNGILPLAWAELYFAELFEMPVSICSYCGTTYRLSNNYSKNTCGSKLCNDQKRRHQDRIRKEENTDAKEKDRKKQQKHRDKQTAIKLFKSGNTIAQIKMHLDQRAKKRGNKADLRSIEEIKEWVRGLS